jgi:hypothetical protein
MVDRRQLTSSLLSLLVLVACGSSGDDTSAPATSPTDSSAPHAKDAGIATGDDAPSGDDGSISTSDSAPSAPDSSPTGGDDAAPTGGDVIDQLLALTKNCTTANMVSKHTYTDRGNKATAICALKGAVFFNSDMDIDCDGKATPPKCPGPDPSYQGDTAFHNNQDQPLAAAVTPYVVIPNDFKYSGLDTQNGGNVIAVIYNHKLQYAVFGDTGPTNIIGEASYATAEKLGIDPNPASGGVDKGVTYIVFVGAGTAPKDIENQGETTQLGETLAHQLIANN